MIKSFRDKETEKICKREYSKRFSRDIQERALMKLQQLHAAGDLRDLSIPSSNQLEALRGDRRGEYSIRVNNQWRICFKWKNGTVALTTFEMNSVFNRSNNSIANNAFWPKFLFNKKQEYKKAERWPEFLIFQGLLW